MTSIKIKSNEIEFNEEEKQNSVTTNIGTIFMYAGTITTNILKNYLECDGLLYNKNEYIELYTIIGNMYNNYDDNDADMFRVPKIHMPIGPNENVNTILYKGENVISSGNSNIEESQFKHAHAVEGTYVTQLMRADREGTNNSDGKRSAITDYNRINSIATGYNLDPANSTELSESDKKEYFPKYTVIKYIICYKI
jgi:hypothetical protein